MARPPAHLWELTEERPWGKGSDPRQRALYAARDLRAGQHIGWYAGSLHRAAPPGSDAVMMWDVGGGVGRVFVDGRGQPQSEPRQVQEFGRVLIPATRAWATRFQFMNHSGRNATARVTGAMKVMTIRRVRAGEEITFDYGDEYWTDPLRQPLAEIAAPRDDTDEDDDDGGYSSRSTTKRRLPPPLPRPRGSSRSAAKRRQTRERRRPDRHGSDGALAQQLAEPAPPPIDLTGDGDGDGDGDPGDLAVGRRPVIDLTGDDDGGGLWLHGRREPTGDRWPAAPRSGTRG